MSSVIVPKSDQINADDLIGGDMTITIREVQIRGGQEQPVSIYFEGSDKAFRPCKSMSRVLVYCWGADARQYVGRSLTLYRDASVKWGGMAVGGIRISHASDLDGARTMVLAESKASRKPFTVKPLVMQRRQESAFTIDNARADLASAETLADLATAWRRKPMAPFREALTEYLELRKVELTPSADFGEGRTDAQHGDQHDGTFESIMAEIAAIADPELVKGVLVVRADAIASLTAEEQRRIKAAAHGHEMDLRA